MNLFTYFIGPCNYKSLNTSSNYCFCLILIVHVFDKDPSILPAYDVIGFSGSVKFRTDSPHLEQKISYFGHL